MNRDLLFISTNRLSGLPTRKQRFASHFKEKGFRVLFVEPPYTYLGIFKGKKNNQTEPLKEIANNFIVLHSFAWFPFFKKSAIFNIIDNRIFLNHIKKAFKDLDFHPEIVWNYMPFLPQVLKEIDAKKVYDCVDDHSAYPGLINPIFVDELEKQTVKLSTAIIVTNKALKEKLSLYGKKPIILGNGVDWELFSRGFFDNPPQIKKQIIYVGAIAEWFDLELVEKIAQEFPDSRIIIIGPVSIDVSRLASLTNIEFKGRMPQEAFTPILQESQVAIIPFKVNKLTERIDPLKVYEYLAAGVPVVSTPVGRVNDLPVLIGNNHEEFVQKIKEAIEKDSNEKRLNRSTEVKQFSWETKYAIVDKIIESL